MKHYYNLLFSLILFFFCTHSFAVQIVRMQIDYNGSTQIMDFELFDDIVGLGPSVANFLTYVNDGRYNDTFIARSIPGFVLQTGSYTFKPADPLCEFLRPIGEIYNCTDVNLNSVQVTSALEPVLTDAPIVNNFNLSNIRGTIAYARTSVVDSATSSWFINLEDNSANLDYQNEGFTVFGSVIDDGMLIADEMATFPIHPYAGAVLGPDFANLPVVNYDFSNYPGVFQSNLIMLSSFTVITRPILRLAPVVLDFQLDIAGDLTPKILTTTLRNTGNEALLIGTIANIPAPFSIITDGCSNVTLAPQTDTCDLVVSFSPTAAGIFTDNLTIPYSSTVNNAPFDVTYPVTGEGIPAGAVSTVSAAAITYNTNVNDISTDVITIRNKGGSPLIINAVNLIGTDNSQFTIDDSACLNNTLSMNATCDLIVSFSPSTTGVKTATVEVLTNSNTSTVTLNGTGVIPVLSAPSSFNLVSSVNTQVFDTFIANNVGSGDLIISSIILSGPDAAFFASGNTCIDTNTNQGYPIPPGAGCTIGVVFTPTDNNIRTATLTLNTNDPITPTFSIKLTGNTSGFGDADSDGIIDSIELASPNGGDGNNDGITDDLQNNVATFDAPNSNYITFISDNVLDSGLETSLANIVSINTIPAGQPGTANFDYGLYGYSIMLPATGDSVNLGILLPANENPTAFYKYGPTPDNTTSHWYEFSYDATTGTGAQFMGQVTYAGLQKNFVIVSYIDGQRGDDDLQPNGSILNNTSGLSFSNAIDSGSSSGSMTYMQIFILLIISICRRRVIRDKY